MITNSAFRYVYFQNIHNWCADDEGMRAGNRVLVSRVSGCLLDSLVHEKYLILGKKTLDFGMCFL